MKISHFILLASLPISTLFWSCGDDEEAPQPTVQRVVEVQEDAPDPLACLEVEKERILVGMPVSLKNCSENAVRFEWDFGDGQRTDFRNPSHTYTNPGTYTIRLSSFNKNDESAGAEVTVEVGFYRVESVVLNRLDAKGTEFPDLVSSQFRLRTFNNSLFFNSNWEQINRTTLPHKWSQSLTNNFIYHHNQFWLAELFVSHTRNSLFSTWQFHLNDISDTKSLILSNDSAEVILDLKFVP